MAYDKGDTPRKRRTGSYDRRDERSSYNRSSRVSFVPNRSEPQRRNPELTQERAKAADPSPGSTSKKKYQAQFEQAAGRATAAVKTKGKVMAESLRQRVRYDTSTRVIHIEPKALGKLKWLLFLALGIGGLLVWYIAHRIGSAVVGYLLLFFGVSQGVKLWRAQKRAPEHTFSFDLQSKSMLINGQRVGSFSDMYAIEMQLVTKGQYELNLHKDNGDLQRLLSMKDANTLRAVGRFLAKHSGIPFNDQTQGN